MKKIFYFLSFIFFVSCGNETVQNNCFLGVSLNEIVNLSNPEFINLQVPGGNTITTLANRRVVILRQGTSTFKAFDLQCPNGDCNQSMTFDGLILKCPCNQERYSSLNGAPINKNGAVINDGSCFALEYNVVQTSTNTLQITR